MMLVISTFSFSFGERGSMNHFINLIVVQLLRGFVLILITNHPFWLMISVCSVECLCFITLFFSLVIFLKSFFYSSFGFMILMCMSPISPSSPWLPRDVSGFYSDRMVTATSPAEHWHLVCMIEFWMSWSIYYYLDVLLFSSILS